MTRKIVIAVDGNTPQAVQLLEWAAENLNIRSQKKADSPEVVAPTEADVHVTILYVTIPPKLPDWGFHTLFTGDQVWEGTRPRGSGIRRVGQVMFSRAVVFSCAPFAGVAFFLFFCFFSWQAAHTCAAVCSLLIYSTLHPTSFPPPSPSALPPPQTFSSRTRSAQRLPRMPSATMPPASTCRPGWSRAPGTPVR